MNNYNGFPVRVLQVIGSMNRGGAETMIMNLYREIDRDKVQFDFLVHTKTKGKYDDEIIQLGGNIYSISQFKGYNAISYYHECCAFFENHPEISVVHGHIGSSAAFYLKAANRFGRYTIAHSHSAQEKISSFHDFFYRVFSFPTRYIADQLFGCSTEAGIQRYGKKAVTKSKYNNFYNAISVERYVFNEENRENIRLSLGIGLEETVIISVGRITRPKNPEFIYRVFCYIANNYSQTKCIWVGTGSDEEKYRKLIQKENLQNRIIMTGVRSDVECILSAADCFFFPSLWEGLPVSVVEAETNGLPCIISDTITKEVEVTNLIEWHSLNESIEIWAKSCVDASNRGKLRRSSPVEQIKTSGYDIVETSKWLQEFYINKSERRIKNDYN